MNRCPSLSILVLKKDENQKTKPTIVISVLIVDITLVKDPGPCTSELSFFYFQFLVLTKLLREGNRYRWMVYFRKLGFRLIKLSPVFRLEQSLFTMK